MCKCCEFTHTGREARRLAPDTGGMVFTFSVALTHKDQLIFKGETCFLLQLLASASYDNKVCIYKEEDDDWECRATLEGHESTVWSLTFDPEGRRLASCSDDRTVKIWKESAAGDGESIRISSVQFYSIDILNI